ncbi:MAG: hypothetical protein AXA67_13240 [Methylothermaceae bacteria B42]|nr:MAG: hypothetical protein AXA67_13240 [Methylothermaceae bacteria B42]HHJ38412.1 DUF1887 family protein [Methylothermaceae bacterium]
MKTLSIPHHVYLVSEDAAPNITPALDRTLRPTEVTLVVSPDMNQRALWLSRVLKQAAGVKVNTWQVDDAWDVEHLLERFMSLLEQTPSLPALNATGGTKPMSIAAFEAFRAYECPVFYVHPFTDELYWLHPQHLPSHQLEDRIKLRHFLMAYGAEIKSEGSSGILPAYQALTEHLIQEIQQYGQVIATLNWYATLAEETLISPPLQRDHLQWPAFTKLLTRFEDAGVLQIKDACLIFPDETARAFVNGGWLEQYVYLQVVKLRQQLPIIQDVKQHLKITRGTATAKIENELDVALLANNRLYLIECKTRRFPVKKPSEGPGAEAIYKLDTLKELFGGLHCQGMIVSYLPMREADIRRARDLGIEICQAGQLQNLSHYIQAWILAKQISS